ncbi:MAG TPA: condensation domain-containing protein, partial [Blastocatellia bacterium]
ELRGLTLRHSEEEYEEHSKYDLTLTMYQAGARIAGYAVYNTDIFTAGTIKMMLKQFEAVLETICSDPDRRLGELHSSGVGEVEQAIEAFNEVL